MNFRKSAEKKKTHLRLQQLRELLANHHVKSVESKQRKKSSVCDMKQLEP